MESWKILDSQRARQAPDDWSTIKISIRGICAEDEVATGLAYLWRDTPTKRMTGLPIYSNDTFRLPGAPWKFELPFFLNM